MRFEVGDGIYNYIRMLGDLEKYAPEYIKRAVYDGTKVVADEIKKNINNLATDEGRATEKRKIQGLKQLQKVGLKHSFGVTKIRNDNGFVNAKVGFDGYNLIKTKKYPKGQPNQMIARAVEGGTSYSRKQPFVAPAIRATKEKLEMTMEETIDREIKKIMQ